MKTIRFAVCGAGVRGKSISEMVFCNLEGVEVCAITDVNIERAADVSEAVYNKCGKRPNVYTDYAEMLLTEKPDAVYISTSWKTHITIALFAMEHNIAVALEVGGAYSEAECRKLIETYERTKTPYMLMENCCFGRDELLATAMARDGKFGEIVYCHGAYMHDLRDELLTSGTIEFPYYRLGEYIERNRENYPTHEIGPIAKLLNICRGNRFVSLTSMSSKARGLNAYASTKENLSDYTDQVFKQGDIIETLITCENGELVNIRLDTTLPAYYSREFTVRGTGGMYEQKLGFVQLDGEEKGYPSRKEMLQNIADNQENYYEQYLPEIWKKTTPEILKAGHGGMDYFEFSAFCDCLRNGTEMPIDVYDTATWMCIAYLSEQSIAMGGAAVPVPDFTDGAYKHRKPLDVIPL